MPLLQGRLGGGGGVEVDEQGIGAEAGASRSGVPQPDEDALLPMQFSAGPTGPLEVREGEVR
ncbi:hypothetical protein BD309DRAFT_968679 [Dichomitus squalens]|nr:hypothetical protein BD309DRAFT_968679 [Dichomitus squalens]